jgi:hypothetical protein
MGDCEAKVAKIPDCDFEDHDVPRVPAVYDGKTKMGPWAFMCQDCFRRHGSGLGLGRGQKLVLSKG